MPAVKPHRPSPAYPPEADDAKVCGGRRGKRCFWRVAIQAGVASLILYPASALAEVCDKEAPGWDFRSGPASQLEHFQDAATGPYGLTIAALLVLAVIFKRRWLCLFGGMSTLLALAAVLVVWSDPIYAASIREGCRASPIWVLAALAGAALTFGALAARR